MSAPNIPERYRAKCEFNCEHVVDIRAEGTHQHIADGWVKIRSGGGAHGVSLLQLDNKWACSQCIDSATRGTLTQARMF
jgi:hypothetical protein